MSKKKSKSVIEFKARATSRNARVGGFRNAVFGMLNTHVQKEACSRTPTAKLKLTTTTKKCVDLNIGIVGGGMAGMYAAMMLRELGIDYQIFEASGERLGGRVFTYYFNNKSHQYAELGAMRFPHNEMQSRLFNFWSYLNKTSTGIPGAEEIVKIPYILYDDTSDSEAGNLLAFNGMPPVTRNEAEDDNSLLGFDQLFEGEQWNYFKDSNGKLKGASALLDAAIEPFIQLFEDEDMAQAWAEVMKYDQYSGRQYLQQFGDGEVPYPEAIVNYIETVNSYTGVFDLAFIEMLLDTYSFENTVEWSAMDGGTDRIAQEMLNRIPHSHYNKGAPVSRLTESEDGAQIHFSNGDGTQTQIKDFDRVIVTLPFSVLRFIDTPAEWSAAKYEAIRSLKMTNAVKIALGFRTRFWEVEGPYSKAMAGGQSNTDLAARSVVYPSFGIGEAGPAYILSSYCWQNDADKYSHLSEEQMFESTLKDVAQLHGDIVYEEYLGHGTSVVWNKEPLAGGGFEFFSAAQFGNMFLNAREPEGRFNFAGEHLDMVHYWIAGSFNSAFRTVWEILIQEGLDSEENLKTLFTSLGGGEIMPTMIPHFNTKSEEIILTLNKKANAA